MASQDPFSKRQLKKLLRKANRHEENCPGYMECIDYFYRNKPPQYFRNIENSCGGKMEPELKDFNGDPRCPSNGEISGTFFMGRPHGQSFNRLPPASPFGTRRFVIPVKRLFNRGCNLYFSDFWCHNEQHYVSLVVTKNGSKADDLCRELLVKMDIYNNRYLQLNADGNVEIATALWVEVFYTAVIDIVKECEDHNAYMTNTAKFGKGKSTPGGIPKNIHCRICNL